MELGKETMSIKEFAEKMSISRSLAYKLAATGQIPVIRLSKRKLVIPMQAVEKMLNVGLTLQEA